MNDDERDAMYHCAVCGKPYVVPGLARDCEKRHAKEGT